MIRYQDLADFKQQIRKIMKHLRAEKVKLSDVVFLAPKKYSNSILAKAGYEVNVLGEEFDVGSQKPLYATIQGFKGLDAKIVILIDIDHITDKNFAKYMYIAGTRARTLLYVVGSEEFWNKHSNERERGDGDDNNANDETMSEM